MNSHIESGGRQTAVLHEVKSAGLIRSYIDDHRHLRWTISPLGTTFQSQIAEHPNLAGISSRFVVGAVAIVEDVVSPDTSGKLVIDIGPAVRIYLAEEAVPDHIELGLLNLAVDEPHILEEVTPPHPQRVGLNIGMARTRPRSKITKVEFELVGGPVEFAGMFDSQGRLRCYSPLVQWGDGGCGTLRWTVLPVVGCESEDR